MYVYNELPFLKTVGFAMETCPLQTYLASVS